MSFQYETIFGEPELIQAMPLNTSRSQWATVSTDTESGQPQIAEFVLAPETRLVEVTVITTSGNDIVFVQFDGDDGLDSTDPDDATEILMSPRSPIGTGFACKTYAVAKDDRKLRLIATPKSGGIAGVSDVYVLEG